MSRIISYPYDDSIKAKDAWVGTDEASRQTKQYTAEALAEYLNISGSISIIGQMTYKYGTTPLNGIGTLAVFGGGPDIVAFSAVVKLTLSNQDISNQRVVEFLDLLVGSDILIAEQGAISTFGYYSIDSYAINATDSNYYDLGVTFKSGNGSMRSDRIYEAQNFVLANDATQSPWNTVPDGISYTAANVGIGTVTPSEKLEVSGGIIGDTLFVRNTDGYNAELLSNNLTTNRTFNFPDVGGTLALTTDITSSPWDTVTGGINYANGNVGIGTVSPSDELTIEAENPTIRLKDISSSNYAELYVNNFDTYLNSNGRVFLQSGGSTRATVTPAGNVGIGTTSPSDKLHVSAGAIRLDDFYQLRWGGTGTGIYGHSSQGLDFYTNSGTTRLKIENSGNVGIGTTSPGEKLDVNGNIKLNQYGQSIYFGSTVNEIKGSASDFLYKSFSRAQWDNAGTYTDSSYVFKQSGSEVFRIHTGGNVGIGTTSPNQLLEVANSAGDATINISTDQSAGSQASKKYINLDFSGYNNNVMAKIQSWDESFSGGNGYLTFSTRNASSGLLSQAMVLDYDGNVGIGTNSPGEKLEVSGNVKVDKGSAPGKTAYLSDDGLYIGRLSAYGGGYPSNIIVDPSSPNHLDINSRSRINLKLNNNTVLVANDSGNVGIGTTTPSEKLEIYGGNLIVNDGTSKSRLRPNDLYLQSSGTINAWIRANGVSYFNGGNVGIGTTAPSTPLHINADAPTIRLQDATSGDNHYLTGNNGELRVQSSGYITMRPGAAVSTTFLANGNVGIGTTSPSEKLEVAGNIQVNGSSDSADGLHLKDRTFVAFSDAGSVVSRFRSSAAGVFQFQNGSYNTNIVLNTNGNSYLNGGNVGIGTTSPGNKLHIFNAGYPQMLLESNGGSWQVGVSTGNDFAFRRGTTGSNYPLWLDSSDNVGIGTTSPSEKLEVDGQVLSDGYRLAAMQTAPATRNSAGTLGEIVIDGNHIYVCYATDSWSRVALDTSW